MKFLLPYSLLILLATIPVQAKDKKEKTPPAPLPEWMIKVDEKGRKIPQPKSPDKELMNPVHSPEWLDAYHDRMGLYFDHAKKEGIRVNTFFENEKRFYGVAMSKLLGGDTGEPLKGLIAEDHQAGDWHRHTDGIDYYACFTLKHQMRKYFYFGELMPADYRKRMFTGAKKWTEKDPNRRPHHAYKKGEQGWGPNAKNSWVDVRTTDNLTLMRDTSVYLMAEESGNKKTAEIYKDKLSKFAQAIYRTGNGEWDSENYLGHSFAPLFNTYDFAKDKEVRALSKAMIDWIAAAIAVKYFRGGANGPSKRDYNHVQPFGGSLAEMGWLMFGAPTDPHHHGWDEVHVFSSAYTPPPAIVNLGTENYERPRELLNSKPPYTEPQKGDWNTKPSAHETYYIGKTFEFGSLAQGTSKDGGDTSGFKVMVEDGKRGVADLQGAPGPDPHYLGSPVYKSGKVSGQNRVAQYRNSAIWLVKDGESPWFFVLPNHIGVEVVDGITFLNFDKTWMALQPINMKPFAEDAELTRHVQIEKKKVRKKVKEKDPETGKERTVRKHVEVERPHWPDHKAIATKGNGGGDFSGFAIEIGEAPAFKSFEDFKKKVLASAKLDAAGWKDGVISYTSSTGETVKMEWADKLADYKVWRNGELHDWTEHGKYVWREVGKNEDGLIFQRYGDEGGTLYVNAGGESFTATVGTDGKATFENK